MTAEIWTVVLTGAAVIAAVWGIVAASRRAAEAADKAARRAYEKQNAEEHRALRDAIEAARKEQREDGRAFTARLDALMQTQLQILAAIHGAAPPSPPAPASTGPEAPAR